MIYYFEFNERYKKYIKKELGNEEIENNKCFTIDGSGDSFKVNVYCNVELALKPNTIVLSKDEELNEYWWVVQEDKSTLIDNNFYLHELQLIGAIEWFKFKFCYTGTFYYHRYSYSEVMQKLLYSLWHTDYFNFNLENFTSEFGEEKINSKFTFKGYTVRNAINEIEKALNVDFKLKFSLLTYSDETITFDYIRYGYFEFIHKNPNNVTLHNINELNEKYQISQFPNKSYASRVIGRVSSVTTSIPMQFPKSGYTRYNSENSSEITNENACIILPFNIDKIDYIEFKINNEIEIDGKREYREWNKLYLSTDKEDKPLELELSGEDVVHKIVQVRLMEKTLYDTVDDNDKKKYTIWYEQGKNILHNFSELVTVIIKKAYYFRPNGEYSKYMFLAGLGDKSYRISYFPLIDEMLVTKNTDVSNDDVIYNQTGQNVDSVTTKEFIDSYAESISIGTLTKSKYHNKESECFKCGDVFVKDDERYVVSSVSIDKYKDIVYAEYKLSKDYVAKTELISADGSIESYAIPQNNIVKRIQEYKTIIQFSDTKSIHNEKYFTDVDFYDLKSKNRNDYVLNFLGISQIGNQKYYLGLQPSNIETRKSSTIIFDFYDNNYCGFRTISSPGGLNGIIYAQYPYNYVDKNGELKYIQLKLRSNVEDTSNYPYISEEEYNAEGEVCQVSDLFYRKDGYEVPVFLFTREYNDKNGYIFGEKISSEPVVSGGLKLYVSSQEIKGEITDFTKDYLTLIDGRLDITYDIANSIMKIIVIKYTNYADGMPERKYFSGKNIVLSRVNFIDSTSEIPIEEFMFARNNYSLEFDYSLREQPNQEQTAIESYVQTYTWTIYLETYKI